MMLWRPARWRSAIPARSWMKVAWPWRYQYVLGFSEITDLVQKRCLLNVWSIRPTKYGIQPMPHSTSTNLSFGWRSRMPVKISVETVSQIEIGAMAINVSLTPGGGFWEV